MGATGVGATVFGNPLLVPDVCPEGLTGWLGTTCIDYVAVFVFVVVPVFEVVVVPGVEMGWT